LFTYGFAILSSSMSSFNPKYASIMSLVTSALYDPCSPFSKNTTTAISGLSYGANPTNHAFVFSPASAVPVFPPTSILKSRKTEYAVPPGFCCN